MANETILRLSGFGIPPYSARGLTETLEPIEAATDLQRTINGALYDFSHSQFRKYKLTIAGSDQRPPAVNGVRPGRTVTVDCISELAYLTATGDPERPVVEGSSREEDDYTYYRPRLTMLVTGFSMASDEWAAGVQWQMTFEEV